MPFWHGSMKEQRDLVIFLFKIHKIHNLGETRNGTSQVFNSKHSQTIKQHLPLAPLLKIHLTLKISNFFKQHVFHSKSPNNYRFHFFLVSPPSRMHSSLILIY